MITYKCSLDTCTVLIPSCEGLMRLWNIVSIKKCKMQVSFQDGWVCAAINALILQSNSVVKVLKCLIINVLKYQKDM